MALFWIRKCAISILRGGKRFEANLFSSTHRIRSVCVFLFLRKPENSVSPTFSYLKKTEGESCRSYILKMRNHRGQIQSVFLRYGLLSTRYPCKHIPTVGSQGEAFSYERGTPVALRLRIPGAAGIYRGTSLFRKRSPLGPYRRPLPRVVWWS